MQSFPFINRLYCTCICVASPKYCLNIAHTAHPKIKKDIRWNLRRSKAGKVVYIIAPLILNRPQNLWFSEGMGLYINICLCKHNIHIHTISTYIKHTHTYYINIHNRHTIRCAYQYIPSVCMGMWPTTKGQIWRPAIIRWEIRRCNLKDWVCLKICSSIYFSTGYH